MALVTAAPVVRAQSQSNEDPVAAVVGDIPVYASQVEWLFHNRFGGRSLDEGLEQSLRAGILDHLVARQLVLARLKQTEFRAEPDEVDLEIARITERVKASGQTLEEWLAANHQSPASLRANVEWQIAWERYLKSVMTDEVLQQYYAKDARRFDGTRIRVAHILFRIAPNPRSSLGEDEGPADDAEEVAVRAAEIRRQIVDGELDWNEAVARHSVAATANTGGDLGWIEYDRPMPPEFSVAAFQLQPGEISEAVRTSIGIHLIRCVEVEPGTRNWYDVREELRTAVIRELFEQTAERQRAETEVRFTGATPWNDPATTRLVVPEPAKDSGDKG